MKVKDGLQEEYAAYVAKNSQDGYSKGVVDYTEKWADLMEKNVDAGVPLKDIAKAASHEADADGITGFMYGCACQALSYFWVHGDALRIWHNGEHGVGPEEQGVVNPAIITIG